MINQEKLSVSPESLTVKVRIKEKANERPTSNI